VVRVTDDERVVGEHDEVVIGTRAGWVTPQVCRPKEEARLIPGGVIPEGHTRRILSFGVPDRSTILGTNRSQSKARRTGDRTDNRALPKDADAPKETARTATHEM